MDGIYPVAMRAAVASSEVAPVADRFQFIFCEREQNYATFVWANSVFGGQIGTHSQSFARTRLRVGGEVEHELHHERRIRSLRRLAESQRAAVRQAYMAKASVLTGGPGVGKTTALRALLNVLEANNVRYCLAAPTGRAAKRMTEATGRPASTLHRLLEYIPSSNDFGYNEHRPLPYQFVIVDEVSMLDILLAYRLVRAVAVEASLLLVGDADQLPSVGPGSVLRDILASERVPATHLTELFRQARESAMIVAAHSVNAGEMPALNGDPAGDFFFLRQEDPLGAQRLIVDLVARRLPTRYGFDPLRDIQVLTPIYRGAAGVDALNEALQERLNADGGPSVTSGSPLVRVPVMSRFFATTNKKSRGPVPVILKRPMRESRLPVRIRAIRKSPALRRNR
jgi:RecD/TraA family predicted helicase